MANRSSLGLRKRHGLRESAAPVKALPLALALLGIAGAAGCAESIAPAPVAAAASLPAPAPPPSAVGCGLGSRAWQQTSRGPCGSSTWRFTPRPDGAWQATEAGCANATGVARYDGASVVLDFQYAGGGGRYVWPLDGQCRSAPGQVSWSAGPLTGQSLASTLAPGN